MAPLAITVSRLPIGLALIPFLCCRGCASSPSLARAGID
jgi:hypothetical protein